MRLTDALTFMFPSRQAVGMNALPRRPSPPRGVVTAGSERRPCLKPFYNPAARDVQRRHPHNHPIPHQDPHEVAADVPGAVRRDHVPRLEADALQRLRQLLDDRAAQSFTHRLNEPREIPDIQQF